MRLSGTDGLNEKKTWRYFENIFPYKNILNVGIFCMLGLFLRFKANLTLLEILKKPLDVCSTSNLSTKTRTVAVRKKQRNP